MTNGDPADPVLEQHLALFFDSGAAERGEAFRWVIAATGSPVEWTYQVWDRAIAGLAAEPGRPPVTADRFLTLADVAEILNISASQTYALVRSGDLQGIQIGGRNQWRVERSKLEEYIEQAYRRTASNLSDLPSTLPADV